VLTTSRAPQAATMQHQEASRAVLGLMLTRLAVQRQSCSCSAQVRTAAMQFSAYMALKQHLYP